MDLDWYSSRPNSKWVYLFFFFKTYFSLIDGDLDPRMEMYELSLQIPPVDLKQLKLD